MPSTYWSVTPTPEHEDPAALGDERAEGWGTRTRAIITIALVILVMWGVAVPTYLLLRPQPIPAAEQLTASPIPPGTQTVAAQPTPAGTPLPTPALPLPSTVPTPQTPPILPTTPVPTPTPPTPKPQTPTPQTPTPPPPSTPGNPSVAVSSIRSGFGFPLLKVQITPGENTIAANTS